MGFDLVRIATTANGMKVPNEAKCCVCALLLEDGVCLPNCGHNACYHCVQTFGVTYPFCPLDGQPFDNKAYQYISYEIQEWLCTIKLKCVWFNGSECTATAVSIRNIHRHQNLCPNNPKNKNAEGLNSRKKKIIAKQVDNWLKQIIVSVNGNQNLQKDDTIKTQESIKDWLSRITVGNEGGDKDSKKLDMKEKCELILVHNQSEDHK